MGSEIGSLLGILPPPPILEWSSFLFICISHYCQLVHNFTDIKGGSQTKAQIRADPVITKLSHPLSQLFKLVKLISSFEIVLRKVLFPVVLFEINELNDCYEKVIFISPWQGALEKSLSESLCRTKLRFVKMNSD